MYVFFQMSQKERIQTLAREGHKAGEIEGILKIEYGLHAYKLSTIYKWVADTKFSSSAHEKKGTPGRKPDEQLLVRIQDVLEEMPFASTRVIADKLHIWQSKAYRYLTQYLGLVYKLSYWVPHSLSDEQKIMRQEQTNELLTVLKTCERNTWHSIVTGDQSWFTFEYVHNGMWLKPIDERPEGDGSVIQVKKVMVTIIWGVFGFYIVDFLDENTKYDSNYFISHILVPLSNKREEIWSDSERRKIWLHLDNCRIHNSKMTREKTEELGFKRAPHPPYSPDIAPSDFFLFGYVKEKLKGYKFKSRDDLKDKILEILSNINTDLRKKGF